jgi:Fic-DOC domain mobile mystery protein B
MTETGESGWREGADPDGATPLADDERDGLRLPWIATRNDLNAEEAANIARALTARRWSTRSTTQLLDDRCLRELHLAMFGDVWRWAGKYRATEKNIGSDPDQIAVRVRDLCADAAYWFRDAEGADEAGARFHHRLVSIHPFANGNGRHARVATDLLMASVGATRFTWGRASLVQASRTRDEYIAALRSADGGDLTKLLQFVRS